MSTPRHSFRTYDDWKTTNPEDEFLGPDPDDRDDEPPEPDPEGDGFETVLED